MPFRSERQRRFLYAKHPDIAEKFANESRERTTDVTKPSGATRSTTRTRSDYKGTFDSRYTKAKRAIATSPAPTKRETAGSSVTTPSGATRSTSRTRSGFTGTFLSGRGRSRSLDLTDKQKERRLKTLKKRKRLTPRQRALLKRLAQNRNS